MYLNWFDKLFNYPRGPGQTDGAKLVRYADDFVILAKHISPDIVDWIEREIGTHFKLTINRDKTKIVKINEPSSELNFLGYSFRLLQDKFGRNKQYLHYCASSKSLKKARERINEDTSIHYAFSSVKDVIGILNKYLRGWYSYFHFGTPKQSFRDLDNYVLNRVTQFLKRLSQRPLKPPQGKTFYWFIYYDLQLERLASYPR